MHQIGVLALDNLACFCVGVNLLVGTESGLMLLDRSGQGKVYPLISRRRFQQMDVLEGLNVLVTISGMIQVYKLKSVLDIAFYRLIPKTCMYSDVFVLSCPAPKIYPAGF